MLGGEGRYLLRLWIDGVDGDEWRATLKELGSESSWNFASLEEFVRFIASHEFAAPWGAASSLILPEGVDENEEPKGEE